MAMAEEKQAKITMFDNGEGDGSFHRVLTSESATDLIRSVDAFLFDCDGVIWKGDKLIDGVPEALEALRSMGKRLVFVTNNSTKSRRQYARKFASVGLDVSEEEIFSSSFAAAMFLKLNDFPRDKKVYVIGEEGILEELELAGYKALGGPDDGKITLQLKSNFLFEHDKNVGAVIVGLDQYINYYKLQCEPHGWTEGEELNQPKFVPSLAGFGFLAPKGRPAPWGMQLFVFVRIPVAFSLLPIVMLLVISQNYRNGQVLDAWLLLYVDQWKRNLLLLESHQLF